MTRGGGGEETKKTKKIPSHCLARAISFPGFPSDGPTVRSTVLPLGVCHSFRSSTERIRLFYSIGMRTARARVRTPPSELRAVEMYNCRLLPSPHPHSSYSCLLYRHEYIVRYAITRINGTDRTRVYVYSRYSTRIDALR